ncbi:MAG TPA: bifunctional phosphoribosyl-AMP cyclohydrolase/phosphoribosyl-ATP diphosphatase HisIE [Polyangiaceae bacterium]|nr:bifunctional phosphoribosyl-AMP cyclohydrolase/phosphoribosyl-ATP diphosphatase HisIE [Polyangiaceae bacterium]
MPTPQPQQIDRLPVQFDADGLVPVIVQDRLTGEVRMLAYANVEAIRRTLQTGRATFWSRSRRELWEKGRTSGSTIRVFRVLVDCDADCLIYSSEPRGNSCHTGARSCFFRALEPAALGDVASDGLSRREAEPTASTEPTAPTERTEPTANEEPQTLLDMLEATLEDRKRATAATSYTKTLYEAGAPRIGGKIREEAGELSDALAAETEERVVSEAADLVYHLLVGLRWRGIAVRRVLAELARRFGQSGHDEKASR